MAGINDFAIHDIITLKNGRQYPSQMEKLSEVKCIRPISNDRKTDCIIQKNNVTPVIRIILNLDIDGEYYLFRDNGWG